MVQRALSVAGSTQREAVLDVVRFSLMHQHTSQHTRIAQKLMRRFRGLRQPPAVVTGAFKNSSRNGSWCPESADVAAHTEWGSADAVQVGTSRKCGQAAATRFPVQTLCRQQQRQQHQPADSGGTLNLLSGDSPVEGAEFRFRPVSPL